MPQWLASLLAALIGASVGSIGAVITADWRKRKTEMSERREALVQRYANLVYSVAQRYHLDADDAADVFQNTWSALWQRLGDVRYRANLGPWLLTVTARRFYQALASGSERRQR